MSITLAAPTKVVVGDTIVINQDTWMVNYVEGPDKHGYMDYYLINKEGTLHYITNEPVILIL